MYNVSQTIVTVQNMRKQSEVGFQEFILAYGTSLRKEGKGESPCQEMPMRREVKGEEKSLTL